MIADPTIDWVVVPSALDGMESPNLIVTEAGQNRELSVVVSSWLNGVCRRAASVHFEGVVATVIVDDDLQAMDGNGSAVYDGTGYLKEARRSALIDRLTALDIDATPMRHFLLVGLRSCLEVVGSGLPHIVVHSDYAEALNQRLPEAA